MVSLCVHVYVSVCGVGGGEGGIRKGGVRARARVCVCVCARARACVRAAVLEMLREDPCFMEFAT